MSKTGPTPIYPPLLLHQANQSIPIGNLNPKYIVTINNTKNKIANVPVGFPLLERTSVISIKPIVKIPTKNFTPYNAASIEDHFMNNKRPDTMINT